MTTLEMLKNAKAAWPELATAGTEKKNAALMAMADALEKDCAAILEANAADVEAARGSISDVMLDRLRLDEKRIAGMADGVRQVAKLPDPVGRVITRVDRPNGLTIEKIGVPMGVVAIIYESRPNVTSDAAALTVKSGNACVLRGGKEAFRSADAIVRAMQRGLKQAGLPETLVQLVQDATRQSANDLMTAVGLVDLLIPRGGAGLIRACTENAKVPCIQTGTGICHVYVDASADLDMALNIIENAKTSRPSVCNAEEVCLVDAPVAGRFLPMLKRRLADDRAAKASRSRGAAPGRARGGHHSRNARRAEGLRHRISGLYPRGEGRGRRGRGGKAHRPPFHRPQRLHRRPGRGGAGALRRRSGQRGGLRQRLHPLHRRRRVRPRLRDGHLHPAAARPRPHGAGGADHLQIRRPWRRTDSISNRLRQAAFSPNVRKMPPAFAWNDKNAEF